jgi:hypothetical protein
MGRFFFFEWAAAPSGREATGGRPHKQKPPKPMRSKWTEISARDASFGREEAGPARLAGAAARKIASAGPRGYEVD